jgi:hypothetical protein
MWGDPVVPPNLTDVIDIEVGNSHVLTLKKDGTVVGWGWNEYGQTGIPSGLNNVVAIAAGVRLNGAKAYATNQWFFSHWLNGDFLVLDQPLPGTRYNRRTHAGKQGNLYVYWTGQVPIPGGQVTGVYHHCLNRDLIWGEESDAATLSVTSGAGANGLRPPAVR